MSKTEFGKPSEAPVGGDAWSLTDGDEPKSAKNAGRLFLFRPTESRQVEVTRGKKTEDVEVIVADVVLLDEKKPAKSEEHKGVFIWGGWVKGALRGYIDDAGLVLGRLVQKSDKDSPTGYIWILEDASAKDEEIAREYLRSADPFRGGSSDDEGDEPKKSKKGKKSKK